MGLGVLEEVVDASALQAEVRIVGRQRMEGQLKETVERTASCIDGCNAGWGQHHVLFARLTADVSQKGTLSRTRFAGEEEAMPRVFHQVESILELAVLRIGHKGTFPFVLLHIYFLG